MKEMTQAEWDELHRIKREHEDLIALLSRLDFSGSLQGRAESLVSIAKLMGWVITIEQVSWPPLAMGNYVSVVAVRRARRDGEYA